MPDLDESLTAARANLLRQIKAPELSEIRHRARSIRRRRHSVVAGAALAFVIVAGTVIVTQGSTPDRIPTPPAASAGPGPIYRGGGLTLMGIAGGVENTDVLKLPGLTQDVEFANDQRGYALSAECASTCQLSLATTNNAGLTWTLMPPPVSALPQVPDLVTVGDDGVLLRSGRSAWFTLDSGQNWASGESVAAPPLVEDPAEGSAFVLAGEDSIGAGCVARQVDVWQPGGLLRRLEKQPKLDVCWIGSARRLVVGRWHGPGRRGTDRSREAPKRGLGALLPSGGAGGTRCLGRGLNRRQRGIRDRRQRVEWRQGSPVAHGARDLPTSPGRYGVSAVRRRRRVEPRRHRRRPGASARWAPRGRVQGELDGQQAGRDRIHAGRGSMQSVLRIQRTREYWVAINLFGGGWVGLSTDGVTWRKLFVV